MVNLDNWLTLVEVSLYELVMNEVKDKSLFRDEINVWLEINYISSP